MNRGGFCVGIEDKPSSGDGFGGCAATMRCRDIGLGADRKEVFVKIQVFVAAAKKRKTLHEVENAPI